jgi:hypothetical protein
LGVPAPSSRVRRSNPGGGDRALERAGDVGDEDLVAEGLFVERLLGVEPERARKLVEQRPFESWEDVQRVSGFDETLIQVVRSAGAQIGGKRD